MRLSIHSKLFLTILLACIVVLIGSHAVVQWSFQRGLVELADAREQDRINRIADRLVDVYRRELSWAPLVENPSLWVSALIGRREPLFEIGPEPDRLDRRPPWMRQARPEPGVWPPREALDHLRQRERPAPLELRLMLLDANGKVLYGRETLIADARRYPLELDDETIGELAVLPGAPIPESAELRFRATQGDRLWVIALATLLLSAALAYPLSVRLVRPVRGFQDTARRLAAGDFSARVPAYGGDEMARLGRDINALAAALEKNERARRHWAADISHELRTPIALLRAEIEALQDGMRPFDRNNLDTLHSDVMRLGRLVDDLYELSTSDLGALGYRMEETDIADILGSDIDAFRRPFEDAGLRLTFESTLPEPVPLHADAQRLSQLFRNLINNSLQYTDTGGALLITLSQRASEVVIDFQDTPPGVPAEGLPRLFDRLYRVEASRSRHTGGAGLGLAIAKNIVEAHGGSISAAPSPLGGLWLRISLPIACYARPRKRKHAPRPHD
ncbi:ATP-binding protein [Thiocystis violacea]|uniref:ATP-binding protein n=1 Tax=Thiocystis violacea TaxID=13725 RepID=UPI0019041E18|nr:ATP-binding protein [Thiocystis violacea]MBK1725225.1 two-component sensor histidine kinase [Thiocystis violacea]